jgi:nucleotide-binding universal stress UspA family protein
VEAARELETDLIVFGWGGKSAESRADGLTPVFSPTIDEVVRESPCHIAVVKQGETVEDGRILVPIRGGPHAELALQFADAMARQDGGRVVAMHLVPSNVTAGIKAQAERALNSFIKAHSSGRVEPLVRESANIRSTILREAEEADMVVMGASASPATSDGKAFLFGVLPEMVAAKSRKTIIVVKTREAIGEATFDQLEQRAETLAAVEKAAMESRAVPLRVERWFGESNFHHREFADMDRLVRLKEASGLTVSLVLPALNEAETIGPIVARARTDLMQRFPLVDELLVMDSDSTDATREIAASEGARVAIHSEVLSRYGTYRGKGEALWKSLYETSGDIIVWGDTDVRNWHPRMVYGTLGPLLTEDRIQYVKGYYRRPIVEGGVLKEGGGGRVTELVARPLLNLFYPELSGMIQPLSGEYAGRRSLLETIPFFTGYAVEIGHLIDVADRVGLDGLGQVDLERRVHRNQPLEGLTKMSFVILQAVIKRLEERHRTRLFAELGSTMKLPRSGGGQLGLEIIELADHERPPMIRIPEYLERAQTSARTANPAPGLEGGPGAAPATVPVAEKGATEQGATEQGTATAAVRGAATEDGAQ